MFYFGSFVTVRLSGEAAREVDCGRCVTPYRYFVERTAVGQGHAPFMIGKERAARRAQADAEKKLRRLLATDPTPDPVPCPACGCYQDNMIGPIRRLQCRRLGWVTTLLWWLFPVLFVVGFFALVAAAGAAGADLQSGAVWVGLAAASFVLAAGPGYAAYVWYRLKQARFDPNRDIPEKRRFAVARKRAVVLGPDEDPL